MRRIIGVVCLVFMLSGCGKGEQAMEQALQLRQQLQNAGCAFDAIITADYGDILYAFQMQCAVSADGDLVFTVTQPETIAGIGGKIQAEGGSLTFDDVALGFEILADGLPSPVAGPWMMIKALCSGYLVSVGADGDLARVTLRDSYQDDAMTVEIWLDQTNRPVQGDIIWDERRILSIRVENFTMG